MTEFPPIAREALRRTAAAIVGAQDAEDVVQEALLKAWSKRRTFRHESRWSTWMVAIVRRTAFNHLRARRRAMPLESLDDVATVWTPPILQTSTPLSHDAQAALAAVPPDLRRFVERWHTLGSAEAAAAELGGSRSAWLARLAAYRRKVARS